MPERDLPRLSGQPGDNEVHVWSAPLEVADQQREELRGLLSPEECRKADQFRFEEHRNAFLASHAVLRIILGGYTGCAARSIEFGEAKGGKPFLKQQSSLRFNLSHSGGLVLIAVANGRELGVDIEQIRPMPDLEEIAKSFFAPGERDDLLSLPPDAREAAFYRCWTRKEAFVKAIGDGLLYPLNRFRVSLRPDQAPEFLTIGERAGSETEWSLHDIACPPRHIAALAVEARGLLVRFMQLGSIGECQTHFAPAATSRRPLP